jgi:hypothetical protein
MDPCRSAHNGRIVWPDTSLKRTSRVAPTMVEIRLVIGIHERPAAACWRVAGFTPAGGLG